ncbi:MAG TPA: LysR substrate-binding domain-containing protein [Gaiellaceae bacterium]|jgi:DNA-binding transcriptional LysR family regulator
MGPQKSRSTGSGNSPGERSSHPAIELRHLRYFLAVSEELHFGQAAQRLHIAQPPLSQAIRKLEHELGVSLLRRTSRVVAQTEAGRVFAEEARNVLAAFDRALAEARKAGGVGTKLRIGCAENLAIERLLRFLTALHETEAALEAHVTHLAASEQVERLRRGDLDLGIFFYAEEYDDLEMSRLFAGEHLAVYLPRDHRLAARDVLGPSDLADETLVTFPREANPALHDYLLASFGAAGYRFSSVEEAGGVNTRDLLVAVAERSGVTFWPSVGEGGETSTIVTARELDPPLTMPDTVVAWATVPERLPGALIANIRDLANALRRESESAEGPDREAGDLGARDSGIGDRSERGG